MAIDKKRLEQKAKESVKKKSPAELIIDSSGSEKYKVKSKKQEPKTVNIKVIEPEPQEPKRIELKVIEPEPQEKEMISAKVEKHTYSFRLADDVFMKWKAYSEAKSNIKIGELTETALLDYIKNNPLNSQENKLYNLELEKRKEQKKK